MRPFALALAVVIGIAAGCSLPTDDSAQVIAQADLAPSLQQSTTTSTTTTIPQVEARDFAYFLLANKPDSDQLEVQQVPSQVVYTSLFEAVEPMEIEGFRESIGADPSLINNVSQYDIADIVVVDGTATVFLRSLGEAPGNRVQLNVAAQLVWTLTGDDSVERVLFNIDGEPALIPTTNADNSTTADPVTTDDYLAFDAEAAGTTTTTSSTTTSTTVPPEDN